MADPEQIYQEVLQEEQAKGSAGPVAEGRAKAARARAEHGSPHPKEAKWWPGAQPQFEGGGAAPAAEAEAPAAEPEPASEPPPAEPAEEAPAATVGAPVQAEPAPEPSPAPAAQAPPAVPPTPTEEAAPAAAAAVAATPTDLAPEARPAGVRHGTTTGTRLRPEDEVTTEAQFEGEAAMARRRKLIDELVGTGVPAVAAQDVGGPRSPLLVLLYLIVPLVAIALLASQQAEPAAAPADEGGGNAGGGLTISASNVQFDTDTLEFPAGEESTLTFNNEDSTQHNVAIYPDEAAADDQSDALFAGEIIDGGTSTEYAIPSLEAGEFVFQCDVHPGMRGTVTVE